MVYCGFWSDGRSERDIYIHYRVIERAKRTELKRSTWVWVERKEVCDIIIFHSNSKSFFFLFWKVWNQFLSILDRTVDFLHHFIPTMNICHHYSQHHIIIRKLASGEKAGPLFSISWFFWVVLWKQTKKDFKNVYKIVSLITVLVRKYLMKLNPHV